MRRTLQSGRHLLSMCCAALVLSGACFCAVAPATVQQTATSRQQLNALLNENAQPECYVFPKGTFPSMRWKKDGLIGKMTGGVPPTVEFYDAHWTRVARAEQTGRYGAVVRGTMPDGRSIVRYVTLYCCNADFDDYRGVVSLSINPLPDLGINPARWEAYRQNSDRFSFGSLRTLPLHDPDVAIFLAGLSDLPTHPIHMDSPRIRDRQWWIELKHRMSDGERSVRAPILRRMVRPSPELQNAAVTADPAYSGEDIAGIRSVCSTWTDSSHEPMVALVVHDGRIIFHEAFGYQSDGQPMATSTPTWMASITKMLTGVVVMQFVDQGLLNLDVPIVSYLPELTHPSLRPLTLRCLLTHTSGLSWADEWASDWNPALESDLALALEGQESGAGFAYHRVGYAIAGKILERLSGRALPYLFDSLVFAPIEMRQAFADNGYGGLFSTAFDVARFGQMLLSHGKYAGVEILSDSAWNQFLPQPLVWAVGAGGKRWGIGCAPLGTDGLSEATFGHEAASGAVFRIDPVHKLVIVVGRNRIGSDEGQYKRHVSRFLRAVVSPLEKGHIND